VNRPKWLGPLLFFSFLALRVGLDPILWRTLHEAFGYLFESIFIALTLYLYRSEIPANWPSVRELSISVPLSLAAGFGISKLLTHSGVPIPFAVDQMRDVFLLILVAPLIEEFLFRFALWQTAKDFIRNETHVLVLTSLVFSAGHLMAFWFVPAEWRVFIALQTLYTVLLGLGAGWRRMVVGSIAIAVLIHWGFNFGFLMALHF
jgi:membrane protease YdiL (CAAX protease family)